MSAMGYVTRIGLVLAVLGALWLGWEVRRRRSKLITRSDESVQQSLDAYRAELQRRRDYYLDSWRWSLWPMLPSLLVLLAGGALYDTRPNAPMHYLVATVLAVAFTLLGVWHYRRKGHDYQRELDALGTLNSG